jgi:hypothetical protein
MLNSQAFAQDTTSKMVACHPTSGDEAVGSSLFVAHFNTADGYALEQQAAAPQRAGKELHEEYS